MEQKFNYVADVTAAAGSGDKNDKTGKMEQKFNYVADVTVAAGSGYKNDKTGKMEQKFNYVADVTVAAGSGYKNDKTGKMEQKFNYVADVTAAAGSGGKNDKTRSTVKLSKEILSADLQDDGYSGLTQFPFPTFEAGQRVTLFTEAKNMAGFYNLPHPLCANCPLWANHPNTEGYAKYMEASKKKKLKGNVSEEKELELADKGKDDGGKDESDFGGATKQVE
ncbi:unnamed protein product [Trifolium pratense]|uniref:Uncharacterized protein n=1 Tax=Trifolium pratense TaxID=57577 RepID=A0ACB0M417_TRIPR|nr:unnamed protein product [Trifolium pratense]